MRVAIVGSRGFSSQTRVTEFVRKLAEKYPDAVVVSGGARGVDTWAENQAELSGLRWKSFRPKESRHGGFYIGVWANHDDGDPFHEPFGYYESYGQAAFARNEMIVADADVVVAFWDGQSRGTKNSMDVATRLGKPVHVYR